MLDGARAKIQFDISFHQSDPNGKFHGVEKLVFDMPRSDWTFMHDRVAHAWFRQVGIAAGCAASARVEINGAYYGLYVAEENTNKRVLAEFFPDNTGGLWKAGLQAETSATLQASNVSRQMAFAKAKDVAAIAAIVDLKSSVLEWAGEALINDADGIYGGTHNFYIYDFGGKGFVYLPNDTDSTFDWMAQNDITPANAHPIAWWLNRTQPQPAPTTVWTAVLNDPAWRAQYVAAIADAAGQVERRADAGLDRHLVAADRRRGDRRSAHPRDAGPVPDGGGPGCGTSSPSARNTFRASSPASRSDGVSRGRGRRSELPVGRFPGLCRLLLLRCANVSSERGVGPTAAPSG